MAILTNLDAIRGTGLDDLIRRVHQDKEDFVIEDQTMPVVAVIDINKYDLLSQMLQQQGTVRHDAAEPLIHGSDISIREVVMRHQMGDSIDDLRRRFAQLNEGQLYSALAYYYEHSDEIDGLIAQHRAARSAAEPGASVRAAEERRANDL